MVRLYNSGMSTNEVGRALRRSRGTVTTVMNRLGAPLRSGHPRGPANKRWKGRTESKGYVYLRVLDDDPLVTMATKGGRAFEHRLVMARHLGRPLLATEHVHHINGVRGDNRIENLQLVSVGHPAGVRLCCLDCGSVRVKPVKMTT